MADSLPTHITLFHEILFQELDDEAVLLNLENERYYGLDDVGMRMWQLLSEHSDTATVLEHLLTEYDVDEATLRQDLANLIDKLVDAGLATVEPQASDSQNG